MNRTMLLLLSGVMVIAGSASAQKPVPSQAITQPDQYVANDPGTCLENQTIYNLSTHLLKRCDASNTWHVQGNTGADVSTCATGKLAYFSGTGILACSAGAVVTPANLAAGTFAVQTDATAVTWDIGSFLNADAVLTFTVHSGSRTLNISNPVVGGRYAIKLIQDSTGGEGLLLGTGCTWKVAGGGSGAVTLTAGAGAIDVLEFRYDGANCLAVLNANFS